MHARLRRRIEAERAATEQAPAIAYTDEPWQDALLARAHAAGFRYDGQGYWNASLRSDELLALLSTEQAERDAQLVQALYAERKHARAERDRAFKILVGIHALLNPKDVEVNGTRYHFNNPHANEALHELSERIRAIPEATEVPEYEYVRQCVAAGLAEQPAVPVLTDELEADMFWDHDDGERCADDILEIAADYGPGAVVKIDRAKRLPTITVRVIWVQGEPCDYEVVAVPQLKKEDSAAAASPSAPAADLWQPIETAPKDGTVILGYWSSYLHECAVRAAKFWRAPDGSKEARWWEPNEGLSGITCGTDHVGVSS